MKFYDDGREVYVLLVLIL